MLVLARSDAEAVDTRMIAPPPAGAAGPSWPSRYVFPKVARLVLPSLAVRAIEPLWLRLAGLLLDIAALPAISFDWWRTALALIILAGPLEAIGLGLATVRLQTASADDRLALLRQAVLGLAVLLLGWRLMLAGGGWGCVLLAVMLVVSMGALALARRIAVELRMVAMAWLADADALAWLMVPAAVTAHWRIGLGVLLAYALISLLMLERALAGRAAAGLGRA
jgi:hypothetical protein